VAKRTYFRGKTSATVTVCIRHVTTRALLTGLAFNTSGLICSYAIDANARVAVTLATLAAANSAWSSGGFREIDATNMPGMYRFDVPNAALGTGEGVAFSFTGANAECNFEFDLWGVNPQNATRMGMTAFPDVVTGNAGAVITAGTGTAQLSVTSGLAQADMAQISADATAANNLEAMFDGTGYNASASAIGTAAAVTTISNGGIAAASFAANAIDAGALAATATAEITAAIKALVVESAGSYTVGQVLSILLAQAAGVTSNGGATFKTPNGASDRIVGTVNGSNERTAITLTPSA
jgi:hypothetical protein